MNKLLFFILIAFVLGCETDGQRVQRVEIELSKTITERNESDLLDGHIVDSLNIFKRSWRNGNSYGEISGILTTQDKKSGFAGPWVSVNLKGVVSGQRNALNLYGCERFDHEEFETEQAQEWKYICDHLDEYLSNCEEYEKTGSYDPKYARNWCVKKNKLLNNWKENGFDYLSNDEKIEILQGVDITRDDGGISGFNGIDFGPFDWGQFGRMDKDPKKSLVHIEKAIGLFNKINTSGYKNLSKEEKIYLDGRNENGWWRGFGIEFKNDKWEYPYNISHFEIEELDQRNMRWNYYDYADIMVSDFHAGLLELGYDLSQSTGLIETKAIWGYYTHYSNNIETIKNNKKIKSGLDFYDNYIKNGGGKENLRNFVMYTTQNQGNKKYTFHITCFESDSEDYTNRRISNSIEINHQQYDFFQKTYEHLNQKN